MSPFEFVRVRITVVAGSSGVCRVRDDVTTLVIVSVDELGVTDVVDVLTTGGLLGVMVSVEVDGGSDVGVSSEEMGGGGVVETGTELTTLEELMFARK